MLAAFALVAAWTPAIRPPVAAAARAHVFLVDQFRWSSAKAGSKAVLGDAVNDASWMVRKPSLVPPMFAHATDG